MENNVKNLLISFSGGETSAFMTQWLHKNYLKLGYTNVVFVFANTGLENEETLKFVYEFQKYFNVNVHWIEAKVNQEARKGTNYIITDYNKASRKGEPFEAVIQKYGIPNQAFPHCTRELKQIPIKAFAKDYFNGKKYHTAIGIRNDEIDRMSPNAKKMGFIYPLISKIPMNKQMINFYWRDMPFRLNLKGYQGNCITCWKKGFKKLYKIAQENPKAFDFMTEMELKYPYVGNEFKKDKNAKARVFFRNNKSALQVLNEAKDWKGIIKNDADDYSYQIDLLGGESCEIWSECNNT